MAIDEGRIVYVGPRAGAPAVPEVVELGDAFLLPGLVNVHTHLELTAMRGYLDGADGAFRTWLLRLTAARGEVLDDSALLASSRLGIAEGLLAGITTYADTSSSGVVLSALTQMGVRGISYQEVFGPSPDQCAASMEQLRARLEQLAPHTTRLVRLGVSPHAPYTVSDDLYRATARFAAAEELPVAVHIAESREEWALVTEGQGPFADGWRARGIAVQPRAASPIALLEATGVLATRPLLIHAIHLTSDDMERMARAGCSVAHCPASNAKLGHGVAPITQLRETVAVGLGTDSVASNNRMDMLDEARLAILLARLQPQGAFDAQHALALATIEGARALGLHGVVGSLEVGKAADLAAFRIDARRDEPIYDPVTALVFGAVGRRALLTAVAGVELVRDGRLLANLEADSTAVRDAAERLSRFTAATGARVREGLNFSVVPPRG